MQKQIEHVALSASAGSGKTFQLAHRYIGLVARGIPPQRICALTFSRKSASEIFDSIVRYLCKSASSQENAAETAQRLEIPNMQCDDFLRILRSFVSNLHALHIGTLDSFVVRIIKAFPFELGISPDVEIRETGGPDEIEIMEETIRQIFSSEPHFQKKFADAFRQATFGREEKQLENTLESTLSSYLQIYLSARDPKLWAPEELLWENTRRKYELLSAKTLQKKTDELNKYVEQSEIKDKEEFKKLIQKISRFTLHSAWDKEFEKIFPKKDKTSYEMGILKWKRQKIQLSKKESACLESLVKYIMAVEIKRAIEQTKGTRLLLEAIDKTREIIRRDKAITLTEAQLLLAPDKYPDGHAITRNPATTANRLYIDYRLNCSLDHWLIDEFQDTSELQWSVLANIIDEVIQDDSGSRSFFYVGDPKQAIYGWRGGNARLFGKILQHYAPRIKSMSLTKSYRSAQPIIDTVNKVFSSLPHDESVPELVKEEWEQLWVDHTAAVNHVPESGYVALIEAEKFEDGRSQREKRYKCYEVVAEILNKIRPVERGITTAVLVRTNKTGKTIVDFLRTKCPEIMTVHEGKGGIMDNAVVPLIMAVIHIAAHPDDTMSWMHLRMSPLAPIIDEMWKNKSQSSLSLLKELHEGGFQKFIRKWTHLLAQNVVLQPFETKRLNDLALAASIFDTTGSRDCNRFVKFIEAYETTEIASEKCVRVMTIHQAKGLEFDLVILPELDGNSWHEVKDPFLIATDDEDNINWILKMPHKQVVEADPQLSTYLKKHEADSFFEELRLFYVAMTRAKRALYMVVPYAGESAKAFNSARFVRIQLTGNPVSNNSGEPGPKIIYERGEPSWYEKLPPQEPQPQTQPSVVYFPPDYMTKTSIPLQFMRLEPARQTVRELNGKILFASSTWEAIESGNAVHNIMKKIEWWDEAKFNDLISVILKTANPNDKILQRAIRICKEALASQEIQSVFKKPEGNVELWREKSFEVIVGQKLISGRFDRVVIMKNASGKPAGADIVDFKTEDIENTKQLLLAKERYKNQINLYREALSRILEIPEQQCRILLVFTSVKKVISAP